MSLKALYLRAQTIIALLLTVSFLNVPMAYSKSGKAYYFLISQPQKSLVKIRKIRKQLKSKGISSKIIKLRSQYYLRFAYSKNLKKMKNAKRAFKKKNLKGLRILKLNKKILSKKLKRSDSSHWFLKSLRSYRWTGSYQLEVRKITSDPSHISTLKQRALLSANSSFTPDIRWKASARLFYDHVFDINAVYSSRVKNSQSYEIEAAETYLDIGFENIDFRIGRQNIVWGELIGAFVADIISARDFRSFILPDLEVLRIPQWSVLAESSVDNFSYQLVWIPLPSFDNYGTIGSDFHFFNAFNVPDITVNDPERPSIKLENSSFGGRFSYLLAGWDVSALIFQGLNREQSPERTLLPGPSVVITPKHFKITQYGVTFSKAYPSTVIKGEVVYTKDSRVITTDIADPDGLIKQDKLSLGLSYEPHLIDNGQFMLQYVGTLLPGAPNELYDEKLESRVTLLVNKSFKNNKHKPQLIIIYGINDGDSLMRLSYNYLISQNWSSTFGADFFNGPPDSFLGQFDAKDQLHFELKYTF